MPTSNTHDTPSIEHLMGRFRLVVSLVVLLSVAAGCSDEVEQPSSSWDLDEVIYDRIDAAPSAPGPAPDAGPERHDVGPEPEDAGTPVEPEPTDAGAPDPTLPSGRACQSPDDVIESGGACSPVKQDCSGSGMVCELVIPGEPPPIPLCRPADPQDTVEEGEPCSGAECVPGHACRWGTCRRLCRSTTGLGCDPGEFCELIEPSFMWGTCGESC